MEIDLLPALLPGNAVDITSWGLMWVCGSRCSGLGDGRVWGDARNDLARIQDISVWPLLVAWPAGTLLGLSVSFF